MKLYEEYPIQKLIREETYLHSKLLNGNQVIIKGPTYNIIGPPNAPAGVFRFHLQTLTDTSTSFVLTIFDHMNSGEQWRSVVETELLTTIAEKRYVKFSLGDLVHPSNTGGAAVYKLEFELKSISPCDDETTCFQSNKINPSSQPHRQLKTE